MAPPRRDRGNSDLARMLSKLFVAIMCGWSVAFFFIVANQFYGAGLETKQN